jgi:hypothetical protein
MGSLIFHTAGAIDMSMQTRSAKKREREIAGADSNVETPPALHLQSTIRQSSFEPEMNMFSAPLLTTSTEPEMNIFSAPPPTTTSNVPKRKGPKTSRDNVCRPKKAHISNKERTPKMVNGKGYVPGPGSMALKDYIHRFNVADTDGDPFEMAQCYKKIQELGHNPIAELCIANRLARGCPTMQERFRQMHEICKM